MITDTAIFLAVYDNDEKKFNEYLDKYLDQTELDYELLAEIYNLNPYYFQMLLNNPKTNLYINNGELLTEIQILSRELDNYELMDAILLHPKFNIIEINTEKEIQQLTNKFLANAKDDFLYPVKYVFDPILMIKYGFMPTSISTNELVFVDFLEGMDKTTINFWSQYMINDFVTGLRSLNNEIRWKYSTLATYKARGTSNAESLPLLLYAAELVYKESKRPINDMSLFRGAQSHIIKKIDASSGKVKIDNEIWDVIPVTRYAAGMRRGLYYQNEESEEESENESAIPTEFCGTFYYYEIESTTLLAYKNKFVAFNKLDAFSKIFNLHQKDLNETELIEYTIILNNYDSAQFNILRHHINGKLRRDLMLTPVEAFNYNSGSFRAGGYNTRNVSNLLQTRHYAGKSLGLYAMEDNLDQPLCKLAARVGYDIVILKSMIGSHQIVTEILDTRSREDSFKSLIYVVS